jgi:hypothetical protein
MSWRLVACTFTIFLYRKNNYKEYINKYKQKNKYKEEKEKL